MAILSVSYVSERFDEHLNTRIKRALFTGSIPIALIPVFAFTAGYQPGTALIIGSAILSARPGLSHRFSLALFAAIGFIAAAVLDWMHD